MILIGGEIGCAAKYIQHAPILFFAPERTQSIVEDLRIFATKIGDVGDAEFLQVPGDAWTHSRNLLQVAGGAFRRSHGAPAVDNGSVVMSALFLIMNRQPVSARSASGHGAATNPVRL